MVPAGAYLQPEINSFRRSTIPQKQNNSSSSSSGLFNPVGNEIIQFVCTVSFHHDL